MVQGTRRPKGAQKQLMGTLHAVPPTDYGINDIVKIGASKVPVSKPKPDLTLEGKSPQRNATSEVTGPAKRDAAVASSSVGSPLGDFQGRMNGGAFTFHIPGVSGQRIVTRIRPNMKDSRKDQPMMTDK